MGDIKQECRANWIESLSFPTGKSTLLQENRRFRTLAFADRPENCLESASIFVGNLAEYCEGPLWNYGNSQSKQHRLYLSLLDILLQALVPQLALY